MTKQVATALIAITAIVSIVAILTSLYAYKSGDTLDAVYLVLCAIYGSYEHNCLKKAAKERGYGDL